MATSHRTTNQNGESLTPREMARTGGLHDIGVYVLLAGAFLPIADFFIVNVALPTIAVSLAASPASLELVVTVYGVAYAAMLVLGGRLGDRFGRHVVFQAGLVGFVLASFACGVSPNIETLVAARLVQGATAALLVPQVLAISHATLESHRKARALALYGATSGIAAVIGQLAGGLLASADLWGMSWRPIFLINIPFGVIVFVLCRHVVPSSRSPHPVSIDIPGTILFAATLTCLLVPLTEGHSQGWPIWCWALFAAAIIFAAATIIVEYRVEARGLVPLLPPSLLKLPSMWRGLSMIGPFSVGFGAFMFVFALTIQHGLHASPLESGLAILPMAVLFFVGSVLSPRIINRFGRAALAVGGIVQAIGLAALIVLLITRWPAVSLFDLALPLVFVGGGQSLLFSGLFRAVLADVPAHLAGVGSGTLITIQQSGLALGVATLGTIYLAIEPVSVPHAFAAAVGIQLVIVIALVFATQVLPPFTKVQSQVHPAEI